MATNDVWNQEFIYLENGQWIFSQQLPQSYSWYDFNNPFVVVLNSLVREPWMHNQFYVSHYPRYYYRSKYNDGRRVYGFNENRRSAMYNLHNNNNDNHGPRREMYRGDRDNVQTTRPSQNVRYNDRNVGSPVNVTKDMRTPRGNNNRNPRGVQPNNSNNGSNAGHQHGGQNENKGQGGHVDHNNGNGRR